MSDKPVVKTKETDWFRKAMELYVQKQAFVLVDDAGIGLTEKDLESAIALIKAFQEKEGASMRQVTAVLAGLGITGVGVWMIWAAIVDPEPTSKLGLLIGGGVILALTGSLGTLASLGVKFSVSTRSPHGHTFEIAL